MSELDSTTSIGGISVELRGDTGPLKSDVAAGIAAAKAAAKANPVVMKMTLDTSALQAHATAVRNATQAFAQLVGSASGGMRMLTPRIDSAPMEGQLARLKTSFAQTMQAMRTAASMPIPVTVSRAGGNGNWTWGTNAFGGGGIGGGNSGGGGINTVNIPNGAGNYGSGDNGDGPAGGGRKKSFARAGFGRMLSGMFIAREIFHEIDSQQHYAAEMISAAGDPRKELAAMMAKREGGKSSAFGLGHIKAGVMNWVDGRSFFDSGEEEQARILAQADKIDLATARMKVKSEYVARITETGNKFTARRADVDVSGDQKARNAMKEERRIFDEENKTQLADRDPVAIEQQKKLLALHKEMLVVLDRENALLGNQATTMVAVASLELSAVQARAMHDNQSARVLERQAERKKMLADQGVALEGEKDPWIHSRMVLENWKKNQAFDAQSKLDVANDAQGFRSMMRSTSQHMVASQQRTGRNFFAAKLTDFDAETGSILDDPNLQARDKPWKAAQRYMQRGELVAEHGFNIGQAKSTLDARAQAAGIRSGTGSPQHILDEQAGVRMTANHMKNEIAAADPELRAKMKATFTSELREHRASLDKSNAGGTAQTMRSYLETNSLMSRDYSDPVRGELDKAIAGLQDGGMAKAVANAGGMARANPGVDAKAVALAHTREVIESDRKRANQNKATEKWLNSDTGLYENGWDEEDPKTARAHLKLIANSERKFIPSGKIDTPNPSGGGASSDIGGGKTIGDLYTAFMAVANALGAASGLGPLMGK